MSKINLAFISILLFAIAGFAQNRPLENLSVDYMKRANLAAGYHPKRVTRKSGFPRNTISLIARTNKATVFDEQYKGIQLLLVNTTRKQQSFPALDGRLFITQEALDTDGEWKPIELPPTSKCGNSYYPVRLGPDKSWEFPAAFYHGSFKTRLRFRLEREDSVFVYSNEFDGSVNPGQFTNKPTPPIPLI